MHGVNRDEFERRTLEALEQQVLYLKLIYEENKKLSTSIDALQATVSGLSADLTSFLATLQTALNALVAAITALQAAGPITPAQQAELDNMQTQATAMDAAIKGFVIPPVPATAPAASPAPATS